MKRGIVETPEGMVHYRTEGKGKPLFMMHRVGMSSDEYTEMIPLLSPYYRVIATDHMGYGFSDLPEVGFKIEDYARNAIHVLDALKIKKTDLVGSRLGASVAVHMATTYPERINKLVLMGIIFPPPDAQKERAKFFEGNIMKFKEDGSHLMDLWKYHMPFTYKTIEMRQRDVVAHFQAGLGARTEDGHIALFSYDMASRLPKIKHSTLLIEGEGDHWSERLDAAKALIPKTQTKIIQGQGHVLTWEKPEEFARAIRDFLEAP